LIGQPCRSARIAPSAVVSAVHAFRPATHAKPTRFDRIVRFQERELASLELGFVRTENLVDNAVREPGCGGGEDKPDNAAHQILHHRLKILF
jgi:hypothetical protein